MASVDCWRLLGVPRGASADEVRTAYARRVRDVHPDSGGTGDAITLTLLKEARDEALAAAERQGHRDGRAAGDGRPEDHRGGGTCQACRNEFPPSRLAWGRAPRRFRGRRGPDGRVLMCFPCRVEAEAGHARAARLRALVAVMAVTAALVLAAAAAMAEG